MKIKTLFLVDLLSAISFIPASATGFVMHWAGHQYNHELWHNWALAHILSTLLFTIAIISHIYYHWGWYKSLFIVGLKNKSRVTVMLTILMLVLVFSGNIVLLRHQGPNSHFGIWHYVVGIIFFIISAGHFLKRCKILFKGLK